MAKNKYLDDYLGMPPRERRRLHIVAGSIRKRKKRYVYDKQDWTRELLIEWAKSHGVVSQATFFAARKNGGPSKKTISKWFGKWSNFRRVLGLGEAGVTKNITAKYLVNVILSFGLWTPADYKLARIKNPILIPSIESVRYHFGSWKELVGCARRTDNSEMIKLYMSMHKNLRRWPTMAECAAQKIDLTPFIQIHETKEKLDKFLMELEK